VAPPLKATTAAIISVKSSTRENSRLLLGVYSVTRGCWRREATMMRRRDFLQLSMFAFAGPLWLRRAFADASLDGDDRTQSLLALNAGIGRSRKSGKPLIVIVIPESDEDKWERGAAFGEWINHGGAEQLAPLALCEVVCATKRELSRRFPSVTGEPYMALALPGGRVRELWVKPRPYVLERGRAPGEEERITAERIAALAGALAQALDEERPLLVERARAALGGLDAATVDERLEAGELPSPALVDRGAALVAEAAATSGGEARARLIGALAKLAMARLRDRAPEGSHWAHASICGYDTVEELPDDDAGDTIIGCGMGHVPAKGSRFLYFYADPPRRRAAKLERARKR
jgi:hypothetical protein